MSIKSFLKLVEIQTKVASVIPFLTGTFYALYRFGAFNACNFLLMFISLLCIDMTTTAINNYLDYKRANKKYGYGYEKHNAIVRDGLKESHVLAVIGILFLIATLTGILLYTRTNLAVLILGAVSFAIGVLYSFGPFPICRTPFGEILSGGAMGFLITFIAMYIHAVDKGIAGASLSGGIIDIKLNIVEVFYVFLVSVPAVTGIGNIMLANNICDIEDDIENKRYTLPVYIGKGTALLVFRLAYYAAFAIISVLLILRVLPVISAFVLLTFFPVNKHIGIFCKVQSKKDTFVYSVKNFVVLNASLALTIAAAAALKLFVIK